MKLFQDITELNEFIAIRRLIDLNYLEPYEEVALRTFVYPFIPEELLDELIADNPGILKTLKKAVAHYTLPLAIPFIKVIISNSGAQNTNDTKLSKSEWWDIRDMALSSAQIADDALSFTIDSLLKNEDYKDQITFDNQLKSLFPKTPTEFQQLTQLKISYKVFLELIPSMDFLYETIIKDLFEDCVLENLNDHPNLEKQIKTALTHYALADIAESNSFVFTGSAIFIKWEQLPWQKSAVLNSDALNRFTKKMYDRANQCILLAQKYVNENMEDFPCMENKTPIVRKPLLRKSGLYL